MRKTLLAIFFFISSTASSFAFEDESRFMLGINFSNNGEFFFLEMQNSSEVRLDKPIAQTYNISNKFLFDRNLQFRGNALQSSQYETGQDFRSPTYTNISNLNYSGGYRNVEGSVNRGKSQDKKFATSAITAGVLILGATVGTVALVVSAF